MWLFSATAWAATVVLLPGDDVQAAVDAAVDGDVLVLRAGSHLGPVALDGRRLTLAGDPGAELSAPAGVDVVTAAGDDSEIRGLTLRPSGARAVALDASTTRLTDVAIVDAGAPLLDGGAIRSLGGHPVLTRVAIDGVLSRRGGVLIQGAASLVDVSIRAADADAGAALWLGGATVDATGLSVRDTTGRLSGAAVYAESSVVQLVAPDFEAITGQSSFGAGIYAWGGRLTVEGGRFVDVATGAGAAGGAVYGAATEVVITDTSFTRVSAGDGGAGAFVDAVVSLGGVRVDGAVAGGDGGAFDARDSSFTLTDSVLVGGSALGRGGLVHLAGGAAVIVGSRFGAGAADLGGAIAAERVDALRLESSALLESSARSGGALSLDGSDAVITQCTFYANTSDAAGAHLRLDASGARIDGTIFAGAVRGGGVATDRASEAASLLSWSLFWDNRGGDLVGSGLRATEGVLTADPAFRLAYPDGDPSDDLLLAPGSPAIDASVPDRLDLDGSRADLGVGGGLSAPRADVDGDLVWDLFDCNDRDPASFPGSPEVAYDGVDQDCDGADLVDVDGDGHAAWEGRGDDCDDADPTIFPGAPDVVYDGVDTDCAGDDDFDADRDGSPRGADCDDADPGRYPAAFDAPYDGIDADCAGDADDDADGDGHLSAWHGGADCDDLDPSVYPGRAEVPYDRIDQNCDGFDLVDLDGDGYNDDRLGRGPDCDDEDPAVHPGAEERWYDGIDQDCDGNDTDADRDGAAAIAWGGRDCDDADPTVGPSMPEIWYDDFDQNCDGADDFDADGDGFSRDVDCDDTRTWIHPGAGERPDNLRDDDCDGLSETADRDGDGLSDQAEWDLDLDPLNVDSDGDGREDGDEVGVGDAPADHDRDGRIDALDPDDDNDHLPTADEDIVAEIDHDRDGIDNAHDTDSDGDGLSDRQEGTDDLDFDGVEDYVDFQGDLRGGGCDTAGGSAGWLPLLLWFARRRARGAAVVAGLSGSATALAQGVDGRGFEWFGQGLGVTGSTRLVLPDGEKQWAGAVISDVASRPVTELTPDGRAAIVDTLWTTQVGFVASASRRVRFEGALPLAVGWGPGGAFGGAGDLRLGGTVSILVPDRARPGLSVSPMFWLPTGADRRWLGSPNVLGGVVVGVREDLGRVTLALNVGARGGATAEVRDVVSGFGPLFGASAQVRVTDAVGVGFEAVSQGTAGFSRLPVEAGLFTRVATKHAAWTGGVSAGLTDGIGAATWRAWVGAAFGVRKSPVVAPVAPPPEAVVEVAPPVAPPPVVVIETPPPPPAPERIVIRESVFFHEGEAVVLPVGWRTLERVAERLRATPDARYVLVEGHTNDHGTAALNQALGRERAEAAVEILVGMGVPREILIIHSYGFDRGLVDHGHQDATRFNRRVEFTVLRPEETDADRRLPGENELPAE